MARQPEKDLPLRLRLPMFEWMGQTLALQTSAVAIAIAIMPMFEHSNIGCRSLNGCCQQICTIIRSVLCPYLRNVIMNDPFPSYTITINLRFFSEIFVNFLKFSIFHLVHEVSNAIEFIYSPFLSQNLLLKCSFSLYHDLEY